jgi:hypothetical protein
MVTALVQNGQTRSLNPTVRCILDVKELVPLYAGWQMEDCLESHIMAAWHRPEIVSGSRGAKK